jgi:hypothetical protein
VVAFEVRFQGAVRDVGQEAAFDFEFPAFGDAGCEFDRCKRCLRFDVDNRTAEQAGVVLVVEGEPTITSLLKIVKGAKSSRPSWWYSAISPKSAPLSKTW